jgi:quinol-cytochrome oxidoreductase complex cytochrome b subunit
MNRLALTVTLVLLAVGVGLDVVTGAKNFPGYAASIGLLGCITIVVVSKWFGRVLSRPEDLYPDDVPDDLQGDLRG